MIKDLTIFYDSLDEYFSLLKSKKRMDVIIKELSAEERVLKSLEKEVQKELKDIEELENKPIKQLFSNILKSTEEQLNKERQEYLKAVLKRKTCIHSIKLYKYEIQILENQISKLNKTEDKLLHALKSLEPENSKLSYSQLDNLKQNINQIKDLFQINSEIFDVIKTINDITKSLETMSDAVSEAKSYDNWGEFYRDIQLGKEIKRGYLDKAESNVYLIKNLVVLLNSELEDLQEIGTYENVYELTDFNTKFYSNLITDWVENNDLSSTMTYTLLSNLNLHKLKEQLDKSFMRNKAKIKGLEKERLILIDELLSKLPST